MKKYLVLAAILLTLSACSSNQAISTSSPSAGTSTKSNPPATTLPPKETVPEPLIKAYEQAKNGNLDRSLTYIALSESDFPNSKYSFDYLLFKGVILSSIVAGNLNTFFDISAGIKKMTAGLSNESELNRVKEVITIQNETIDNNLSDLENVIKDILKRYPTENETTSISKTAINQTNSLKTDFFAKVGYPVPTESELQESLVYYKTANFNYIMSVSFPDGVDYAGYFHSVLIISKLAGNKTLAESVASEIVKLTENNKYDEKRLDAQEFLKGAS